MSPRFLPFLVLVGLCVLIPLPILDGWVERRLTRAMFRRLALRKHAPLDAQALRTLTEDRTKFFPGCIWAALIWPLKKIFDTVLFVLLVKDGVDRGAVALVRGQMLAQALDQGLLVKAETLAADAERVRTAMEEALVDVTTSPIGRFFKGKYNPALPVLDTHPIARLIHKVHVWSGGGVIVPKFAERLQAGGGSAGLVAGTDGIAPA